MERGPGTAGDRFLDRLHKFFFSHWDEQPRVEVLGTRPSGVDEVVRFRASRFTEYVQVHIQHDGAGGGGLSYNSTTFVTSTRVDCQSNRQQDYTVPRPTADDYIVWFIPVVLQGDRTTYTKFDGEDGDDFMAMIHLGAP